MRRMRDASSTDWLAAFYALYQSVHVVVNTRGLGILLKGGTLDFPAPPPVTGWSGDLIHLMIAIGFLDLLNALMSLLFVWGYYANTRWHLWLGTITLTVSVYAAFIYAYWTFASGAWTNDNLIVYLIVNVGFLPILVLWTVVCFRGAKGATTLAAL